MTHVLIAGGGVAGAATALALHRAGIPAAVYEAHGTGGADAGAFLTVMANGMAALDAIGATEAVLAVSHPARTVDLYDARGLHLGGRPIQGPARTMRRAALYRALQDLAAERGIPVHHGRRLTGVTTGDGVVAEFADGTRASGDVLVGADGLHSRTRRLIDPAAPAPRHTGEHVIYGYADGTVADVAEDGYHMIRGGRAAFGFTAPGDGRTWWFARVPVPPDGDDDRSDGDRSEESGSDDGGVGDGRVGGNDGRARRPAHGARDWHGLALAAVRDDETPAAGIIAATAAVRVVGGDSYDIPATPRWHGNRMVLAGDAAHAASPAIAQGASMALADAVALAEALRAHPEPERAFAAYEARRRAETEETVAASAALHRR